MAVRGIMSMVDARTMLMVQANALAIMSKSSMPQNAQDETIGNLSNLVGLTLGMMKHHFNLTDNEAMALLTLVVMEVMELVDD